MNLNSKVNNKRNLYSLLYLICLFLVFSSLPFNLFIKNTTVNYILLGISRIIFIIIAIFLLKKDPLFEINIKKHNKKIIYFLPFIIACFSNFFTLFFYDDLSYKFDFKVFLTFAFYYLCVALSEEFIFRFITINFFKKDYNLFKTLIFSSLIFGGMHLLNIFSGMNIGNVLIQVVYTFALGLILGLIYLFTNNFIYVIIFHYLYNLINDTLYTFVDGNISDLLYYAINIVIALILTFYGIIIYLKLKKQYNN